MEKVSVAPVTAGVALEITQGMYAIPIRMY